MEPPIPPGDPEQRNIIEKLADFVARNGQEFELLTKEKQRDNPKFAFLHGGEFYEYYNFKVEEARERWQTHRPYKDNYQPVDLRPDVFVAMHFGFGNQWGGARSEQGDPHWEQFGGAREYGQRYPVPNQCGWANRSDGSWFPPPAWSAGGPPYQGGSGMPPVPPGYGPPPHGMAMGDNFRGRDYGMQPSFGYPGPDATRMSFQSPGFPYSNENFNEYQSPGNYGPSGGAPDLNETDIEQSEKNLKAQHEVLMARQASEIDELLDRCLMDSVKDRGSQHNLSIDQMNEVIQPLIESCTKENISKGKTWVIERGSENQELAELVTDYLLARAAGHNVSFDLRLHLVYLVNDLLHHFKRRGASTHLQESLQRVVPLLFCLASELADEDKKAKLNRVLDIWDSNGYLPPSVLEQMKPQKMDEFLSEWKDDQRKASTNMIYWIVHSNTLRLFRQKAAIDAIKQDIDSEYSKLEQQHKEFTEHVRRQLARPSHSDQDSAPFDPSDSSQQILTGGGPGYGAWGPMDSHPMAPFDVELGEPPRRMHHGGYFGPPAMQHPRGGGPGYPPHPAGGGGAWSGDGRGPPPNWGPPHFQMGGPHFHPPHGYGPPGGRRESADSNVYVEGEENDLDYGRRYDRGYDNQYDGYYRYEDRGRADNRGDRSYHHRSSNRPSRFSSSSARNDTSRDDFDEPRSRQRGSHGASDYGGTSKSDSESSVNPEIPTEPFDPVPKCPPWELPAALMHPLIRLCDFEYTPLDSTKLRLLPAKPPTERLLTAIDNFYMPPSHDRTRDGEGWERLGLYEFYSKKEKARDFIEKQKNPTTDSGSEHSRCRRRKHSGSSGAASPSGDESPPDSATYGLLDADSEHMKPFARDVSHNSSRPVAFHLAHITAYPSSAIGQGVRTGAEALTCAPPPMHCMQGQLTHNYPGYKAVGPPTGPSGIAVPPPRQPPIIPGGGAAPPGFPGTSFLQFPPPSMSQPPPNIPHGLIQRSPVGPGSASSVSRSRLDSRQNRGPGLDLTQSVHVLALPVVLDHDRAVHNRVHDLGPGPAHLGPVRGLFRPTHQALGMKTALVPLGMRAVVAGRLEADAENGMYCLRVFISRSHSGSGSPIARFTSAPGPGGIGSGVGGASSGLSAARAAAMAAAASITNTLNANKGGGGGGSSSTSVGNVPPQNWSGGPDSAGSSRFGGSYLPDPPPRGPGRTRFTSAIPNPSRVAEMHLLGAGPEDRYPPKTNAPP
ncbi:calcium homeostasis endoplasmic reticulum protein [Paragonimus westermani]|uniref:Calcium homeostasis endoplasmic reticulum protein n=1 Tax=Paragonimus westermani TaxID=34504 RepID=A0A5J4NQQ7_9TREM|nr:calcium homeostasis endoplasmic reticulum protein [Paragonimus westermani]